MSTSPVGVLSMICLAASAMARISTLLLLPLFSRNFSSRAMTFSRILLWTAAWMFSCCTTGSIRSVCSFSKRWSVRCVISSAKFRESAKAWSMASLLSKPNMVRRLSKDMPSLLTILRALRRFAKSGLTASTIAVFSFRDVYSWLSSNRPEDV